METKGIVKSTRRNVSAFGKGVGRARRSLAAIRDSVRARACAAHIDARTKLSRQAGQGTTEYAILVGVIVVIAILAITVFRPKLQELWDAIANGINSL